MSEWNVGTMMDQLDNAFDQIDEVIENIRAMGFRTRAEEVEQYARNAYEVAMDTLEDYEREGA